MAVINNPTPVQSGITPGTNDQNTWATHYAEYGAGGFMIVEDDTERDAISTERRVGKMVYNKATGKLNHHNGTTWVETSVGNSQIPQSVLDDIKSNSDEVKRLKTIISDQPTEVYSYRGNTIPTLPVSKKAYYVSLYAIPDNSILTLPANAAQGVVVVIDNADINTPMKVQVSGTDIINGAASNVAVPNDNMLFLAKGQNNNWVSAFSGYIPPSLSRLIADVKQGLPSTGTALTITEIEAALKDKLHTFREIQTEFDSQLHTISELEMNGFERDAYIYGFVSTSESPTDRSWVINQSRIDEPLNIPAQNKGDLHLAIAIPPIVEPLILRLNVNDSQEGYTSFYYTQEPIPKKILITNKLFDTSKPLKVQCEIGVKSSGSSDIGLGIVGDDPTNLNIGITDLELPSAIVEVDPNEDTKAIVKTYVNVKFPIEDDENPNANQEFKSNSVKFLPPLQGFVDPDQNEELGAVIEIDHLAYEKQHNSGFLAYMSTSEVLVESSKVDDRFHRGALWFDDIVIDADGVGITKNRVNKSFGIQEYDGKDPNLSGGTDFLIAFRISMAGEASNGGYIRIFLAKNNATPLDDPNDIYITDKNGQLLAEERHYQKGETLGDLQVLAIVNATSLKEFKCVVTHSITGSEIHLNEKEEGISGLMIQSLTSVEKTGLALTQFESDSQQNINFTQLFLGGYRSTLKYAFSKNIAFKTIAQGSNVNYLDGWGYYAIAQNGFRIQDGYMEVDNDFNLHKIFSADETRALRGKQIKVTTELTNTQTGYIVALMKHTGKPDEYSEEILKSRNQFAPVFETDWEKVDQQIINVDVVDDFHTKEKIFTIPVDAVNYAVIIYPETDFGSAEIKLRELRVDVLNPFNAYYLHSTEDLRELHLVYDKEYKHLQQDTQGYYSLRYTIDNKQMSMPVGVLGAGQADITLDPSVNKVAGSAAKGGEGAVKFNREGVATINTSFRVWSEQDIAYNVQFWYSKVSDDGQTFTKIDDSDVTQLIQNHVSNVLLKMPEFEIQVNPGDRIALFAQSDVKDGAFIECIDDNKPMIDTDIIFKEIIGQGSDIPDDIVYLDSFNEDQFEVDDQNKVNLRSSILGLNLSLFDKVYTQRVVASYVFHTDDLSRVVTLDPFELAGGVDFSILAVHKLVDGQYIKEMQPLDYQYDYVNKKLQFAVEKNMTGQIIIEFHK